MNFINRFSKKKSNTKFHKNSSNVIRVVSSGQPLAERRTDMTILRVVFGNFVKATRRSQRALSVFVVDKTKRRNYFPVGGLVFITEIKCVYCAVRTEFLIQFGLHLDNVETGDVFSEFSNFSPAIIIPPVLHTHPHQHVTLTSATNGWSL